jgi:hypothetical protein
MKHLLIYGYFTLSFLLIAGAFNWFIDPYGMNWEIAIDGINAKKTEADKHSKLAKPKRANSVAPSILWVGNSRVEIGILAESNLFKGESVYNLGIPGAGLPYQLEMAAQQIDKNPNLNRIFISLDYRNFLLLNGSETKSEVSKNIQNHIYYQFNSFRGGAGFLEDIKVLFSVDTLISSLATIALQRSYKNHVSQFGSNSGETYKRSIEIEGKKALFKHQLISLRSKFNARKNTYNAYDLENTGITLLRRFMQLYKNEKVEITFFINPYHASYFHTISETGQWESFIQWKIDLAHLNGAFPKFEIIDFSLFNSHTSEKINLKQNDELMYWFWEPAHYRRNFGNIIINALLNKTQMINISMPLSDASLGLIIDNNRYGLQMTMRDWKSLNQAITH